jgi:hypothetical protein
LFKAKNRAWSLQLDSLNQYLHNAAGTFKQNHVKIETPMKKPKKTLKSGIKCVGFASNNASYK